MLVGAADVGGNYFENDPMLDLATARVLHFRIVDFLYFDLASAEIHHTTIARHAFSLEECCCYVTVQSAAFGAANVLEPCFGFDEIKRWIGEVAR
jgi:hypothetical protein